MFLDSVGIILRKNELSPYKITLLDKIRGKIESVTSDIQISVGALITYNLRQKGSTYFVADAHLIYIPLSLAKTDMLFFHHVLELIYYFTQVGNNEIIFDLIAFLYSTEHADMTVQTKKIFLLQLLSRMGSVPELNHARSERIMHLTTMSMKQLNGITISSADEKELDRWLWCCVWQHPYVNEFRTVHFLVENRVI